MRGSIESSGVIGRLVLLAAIPALLLASGCATAPRRPPERPPVTRPAPAPAPEPAPKPSRPPRPMSPARIMRLPLPESLPIPVDGVDVAELSNSFNAPRSGGRRHKAIDIFAPRNTPVRATTVGHICCRGLRSLGGRTISVIGPGGHRHYFAHLEVWAGFDNGDFVQPGDVIGYVGNSGNARAGPTHLHYAIYRDGAEPLDPYPLLRGGPGPFEPTSSD